MVVQEIFQTYLYLHDEGDRVKNKAWLVIVLLMVLSHTGCIEKNYNAMEFKSEMPGMYETASAGGVSLVVLDMHRYEIPGGSSRPDCNLLAIGVIIQSELSESSISIDPSSFKMEDRDGGIYSAIADGSHLLKNPLLPSKLLPGDIVWGAIGFELPLDARPKLLRLEGVGEMAGPDLLEVRLDCEVVPPSPLHSPIDPVAGNCSVVTIKGISESKGSSEISLCIDYSLKNSGSEVLMLDGRGYGRFADLIDTNGMSYCAYTYSMHGPVVPPGGVIEGQLCYKVPGDVTPGYLIFWPPDEDAIVFDLRAEHL